MEYSEKKYHKIKIYKNVAKEENIWRYMDIYKFIMLVLSNKLWLTRADKLGDHSEGASSGAEIKIRDARWTEEENRKMLKNGAELRRLGYFISCWTMNNPESNAMWQIYAPNNGIAIESHVENLATCCIANDFFDRYEPIISSVIYEKSHKISSNLYFNSNEKDFFLRKQEAFEYEKEIRLIITSYQTLQEEISEYKEVDIDLDKLIERIYIYNENMKDNIKLFLQEKNLIKEIKVPFFRQKPLF